MSGISVDIQSAERLLRTDKLLLAVWKTQVISIRQESHIQLLSLQKSNLVSQTPLVNDQ